MKTEGYSRGRRRRSIGSLVLVNLRWGAVAGLLYACGYSLYVIGLYLVRGQAPFDAYHTTVGRVVIAYFGIGVVGGAIVGLLRPLLGSRLGTVVVGIVTAFVAVVGFVMLECGSFLQWDWGLWLTCLLGAILVGPPAALGLRHVVGTFGGR